MAKIDFEERTTTIEKKPKTDLLDLIDKRMNQTQEEFVKSESQKFDFTHKPIGLNEIYQDVGNTEFIPTMQQASKTQEVINPFFGNTDALSKLQKSGYQEVVTPPEMAPTLEIQTYTANVEQEIIAPVPTQRKKQWSKRVKLWFGTGLVSLVLLTSIVVCNALNLGHIDRQISTAQQNIVRQEKDLDSLNTQINGVNKGNSGMTPAQNGVVVDISVKNGTQASVSDNFFNRLCEFIASLFGK